MVREVGFWIWQRWERLFRVVAGVRPLSQSEPFLFYIAKRTYLGRTFAVDDLFVKPCEKVVEIHMNNDMLVQMLRAETSLVGLAVSLLREAKRALPIIAVALSKPEYDEVHVIYGVTFIHRGITRLGFHIAPIRNHFIRGFSTLYLRYVFKMVNPQAQRLMQDHRGAFYPMMVAMSKTDLIHRYGAGRVIKPRTPVPDSSLTFQ